MTMRLTDTPVAKHVHADSALLTSLTPSKNNPRKTFEQLALQELADSIKAVGMIEPIVVREIPGEPDLTEHVIHAGHKTIPRLEIVAGHRRYLAAQLAGLSSVPIRNLGQIDDVTTLKLTLVENLQRVDLDPIEEGEGYFMLNRVAGMTQPEIAKAIHRNESTISDKLRLLQLPDDVKRYISAGALTGTHGIALLKTYSAFPNILSAVAKVAVRNSLSSARLESNPDGTIVQALKDAHLIAQPSSYRTTFDTKICKEACPFGAYRTDWGYEGACLRPDHYHEMETAAVAEREKRDAERLAARAAKVAAGEASGVPLVALPVLRENRENIETDGVPKHSDLKYGTFEDCGHQPPAGCTDNCACRSYCREYKDGPLVAICLEPQQFRLLKRRETIARNKTRRKLATSHKETLGKILDALTEIGPAELTVLTAQIFKQSVKDSSVSAAWHALTHPEAKKKPSYGEATVTVSGLAERAGASLTGQLDLVRLAVQAILEAEIALYDDGYMLPELTYWYLAAKGAKEENVAAVVAEAQAEAAVEETVATGPPCDGCGQEGLHLTHVVDEEGEPALLCATCLEEVENGSDTEEGEDDDRAEV